LPASSNPWDGNKASEKVIVNYHDYGPLPVKGMFGAFFLHCLLLRNDWLSATKPVAKKEPGIEPKSKLPVS
jgi:hypothetical protein